MHKEILNQKQLELLPLLKKFKKEFFMVGGTSIALHIGHRLSIDFDLFKQGKIKPKSIINMFQKFNFKFQVTLNIPGQLNLICNDVKFTFFDFEFDIPHHVDLDGFIYFPNLLDLAAMKAYALGHRSKWKDYLDLYFILKSHYSIEEISTRAEQLFETLFSEKLFRAQLSYFKGISFEEQVEFMPGFETDEEVIKAFLIDVAITRL